MRHVVAKDNPLTFLKNWAVVPSASSTTILTVLTQKLFPDGVTESILEFGGSSKKNDFVKFEDGNSMGGGERTGNDNRIKLHIVPNWIGLQGFPFLHG